MLNIFHLTFLFELTDKTLLLISIPDDPFPESCRVTFHEKSPLTADAPGWSDPISPVCVATVIPPGLRVTSGGFLLKLALGEFGSKPNILILKET